MSAPSFHPMHVMFLGDRCPPPPGGAGVLTGRPRCGKHTIPSASAGRNRLPARRISQAAAHCLRWRLSPTRLPAPRLQEACARRLRPTQAPPAQSSSEGLPKVRSWLRGKLAAAAWRWAVPLPGLRPGSRRWRWFELPAAEAWLLWLGNTAAQPPPCALQTPPSTRARPAAGAVPPPTRNRWIRCQTRC